MSLIIAGERSGAGKTTVTLAILAALRQRSLQDKLKCDRNQSTPSIQSFKVGPDYIDPMFHQAITQIPCRNLDPVLTSEAYVQQCFERHAQQADYALVEGVMGLFDGATGESDFASTAHIARLLNLPILLVIDCSRLSRSVAAIAHGYRTFDPRLQFAGLVLNRVGSDRHLDLLKSALTAVDLPILGVLRRDDQIQIPDRHLGLVPTAELPALQGILDKLTHIGETCFDWQRLLPLLKVERSPLNKGTKDTSPAPLFKGGGASRGDRTRGTSDNNLSPASSQIQATARSPLAPLDKGGKELRVRIAVACDLAFSFYYADNLEILEQLGAELLFWSPLTKSVPETAQGLYFGGGFPEMFAAELSDNQAAIRSVQQAIQRGLPTYAECGGLMYLCQHLQDFQGQAWPMVGALPTTAVMGKRLSLGYRRATAQQSSYLLDAGETVWGHEFHRSHLTELPELPMWQFQSYDAADVIGTEGWSVGNVYASYLHLHWGEQLGVARRFVQAARMSSASL
ncbi:MAG: cobyrinate a,c-diamide synthase [Thainema sp.]